MAKRSSDPRVAYPEANFQEQDVVRVVGIVAPFANSSSNITFPQISFEKLEKPHKIIPADVTMFLSRNLGYKTRGVAIWLNIVLTPG